MAGVTYTSLTWVKLQVGLFSNRKIKQLEHMPDGPSLVLVWIKLICLAGTVNDCGRVYLTEATPYTEEMLATEFNMPITTIRLALRTFEHFGMIEIADGMIVLANWHKYQGENEIEKIREQNRKRKQAQREREKLLKSFNVT